MRRGVKAQSAKIVARIRGEIGIAVDAPIDPWKVASHLNIPAIRLDALAENGAPASAIRRFVEDVPDMVSAYTMWVGGQTLIVVNPGTTVERQVSSLAHELGHILLKHEPPPAIDPQTRCRNVSNEMESEADWFGGVLLVPDEAALAVVRTNEPVAVAAKRYGVSTQLMQMRINLSGAEIRLARTRRPSLLR